MILHESTTLDNKLTSKVETEVQKLASFVVKARYDDISVEAYEALKIRILDSLGCAIGAVGAESAKFVRAQVEEFGGNKMCSLIGGGQSAPDRAAFYNGTLVRYLDFNDSYLAKGETCHPSDNLSPVLAAAEYAEKDGRTLLRALAVAYQVQCRLSELCRYERRDLTTQSRDRMQSRQGYQRRSAWIRQELPMPLPSAGQR